MTVPYDWAVVWGVHEGTHRHIHRHFTDTLVRLGIQTRWVRNEPESLKYLKPGALVIAAWDSSHLEYRDDVDYVMHNVRFSDELHHPPNIVNLQVFCDLRGVTYDNMGPNLATDVYYDSLAPERGDYQQWGPVTLWNPKLRVLCQPWGTPVFAEDFGDPVWNPHRTDIVFVGSVWDNAERMGNKAVMALVQGWCSSWPLPLHIAIDVTDEHAERLVRSARLAPAVGGEWQANVGMLPCRGFKNISYGAFGFGNLPGFHRLLGDSTPVCATVPELMEYTLSLGRNAMLEATREQQEIVKNHTYVQRLEAICRALQEGR